MSGFSAPDLNTQSVGHCNPHFRLTAVLQIQIWHSEPPSALNFYIILYCVESRPCFQPKFGIQSAPLLWALNMGQKRAHFQSNQWKYGDFHTLFLTHPLGIFFENICSWFIYWLVRVRRLWPALRPCSCSTLAFACGRIPIVPSVWWQTGVLPSLAPTANFWRRWTRTGMLPARHQEPGVPGLPCIRLKMKVSALVHAEPWIMAMISDGW